MANKLVENSEKLRFALKKLVIWRITVTYSGEQD